MQPSCSSRPNFKLCDFFFLLTWFSQDSRNYLVCRAGSYLPLNGQEGRDICGAGSFVVILLRQIREKKISHGFHRIVE